MFYYNTFIIFYEKPESSRWAVDGVQLIQVRYLDNKRCQTLGRDSRLNLGVFKINQSIKTIFNKYYIF